MGNEGDAHNVTYMSGSGELQYSTVLFKKYTAMENRINLSTQSNSYLQHFYVAQTNLNRLIVDERMLKRLEKSKRQLLKPH